MATQLFDNYLASIVTQISWLNVIKLNLVQISTIRASSNCHFLASLANVTFQITVQVNNFLSVNLFFFLLIFGTIYAYQMAIFLLYLGLCNSYQSLSHFFGLNFVFYLIKIQSNEWNGYRYSLKFSKSMSNSSRLFRETNRWWNIKHQGNDNRMSLAMFVL